jgi:hypothetical protein
LVVNGSLLVLISKWFRSRSLASRLRHEKGKIEIELRRVQMFNSRERKEEG